MSAQPTKLPEWATDEILIVEPSSDKKETGWEGTNITPNEKPRYQYDNWFKNLVYQWIAWMKDQKNYDISFSSPYYEIIYDADDKVTDIDYYESVSKVSHFANISLTYDSDDKITVAVLSITGGTTYTATLTYDADDKVTSVSTVES